VREICQEATASCRCNEITAPDKEGKGERSCYLHLRIAVSRSPRLNALRAFRNAFFTFSPTVPLLEQNKERERPGETLCRTAFVTFGERERERERYKRIDSNHRTKSCCPRGCFPVNERWATRQPKEISFIASSLAWPSRPENAIRHVEGAYLSRLLRNAFRAGKGTNAYLAARCVKQCETNARR